MNAAQIAPPDVHEYKCIRAIGAGSYGQVWLAESRTGSMKALKVVRRQGFQSDEPFMREYKAIQRYENVARGHSSLIDILHVGFPTDEYFYYVMPLGDDATGRQLANVNSYEPLTLSKRLARGRLSVSESVSLVVELLRGVEVLHANGLVHRDIKPGNIVFIDGKPVLADIGLVTETNLEMSNLGTSGFMAPEGPGKKGDLYAIGMTLYVAVSGMPANDMLPAPTLRAQKERESYSILNKILLKACSDRPKYRYSSAKGMRMALEEMASPAPSKPKRLAPKRSKPRITKEKPPVFRTRNEMQKHVSSLIEKRVAEIREPYPYDQHFLTVSEIRRVISIVKEFFKKSVGTVPADIHSACRWAEAALEPNGVKRRALIQKATASNSGLQDLIGASVCSIADFDLVNPFSLIADAAKRLTSSARITYYSTLFGRVQADSDLATRKALEYLIEGVKVAIDENWHEFRAEW